MDCRNPRGHGRPRRPDLRARHGAQSHPAGCGAMNGVSDRIAIAGGGLAGSLLALGPGSEGPRCRRVRAPSRSTQGRRGRGPLDQSGSVEARHAGARAVGLLQECSGSLRRHARPCDSRAGRLTRFQPYGKNDTEVLHSIDRNELNRLLLERAGALSGVRLHFAHRLIDADLERRELEFECDAGHVSCAAEVGDRRRRRVLDDARGAAAGQTRRLPSGIPGVGLQGADARSECRW